MKDWLILLCTIIMEVAGTSCLKLSEGFTRPVPSVLIFVFYGLSFFGLTFAVQHLDLSITYAVWSGLGTALIAVVGFAYFKEPVTAFKIVSMGLIITGVVGLNLSGIRH
jgi:small multidrug resistance pump